MSRVDLLRADLESALADLIDVVEGMSAQAFERPRDGDTVRDLLWRSGLHEDWTRRVVDQGVSGRPVDVFVDRDRPAIAQTVEYLVTWLEQSRRPMLALLRRLPEDALDREFVLATSETSTAVQLIEERARDLREDAARIRAWRDVEGDREC